MQDSYFVILTVINVFLMVYMCRLVMLCETITSRQASGFMLTFMLVGCISILELISVIVDNGPVWLRWLNILSNLLGFGLTPAVPVCLVYTLKCSERLPRSLKAAMTAELVYLLILIVSLFVGGFVYTVDEANHYARHSGFNLYLIANYASIAYLLFNTLEMARSFQNRGRELIYAICIFLAVGTMIQVLNPQIHITWLCVTLITMMYYLYCTEMWNQLDGLTGLLSQKSYLNRTMNMSDEDKVLIVFDVDDFKQVNDTAGHLTGDRCLKVIALCLKQTYARYGTCYRIGGDEFCVLLRNPEKETICREKLIQMLDKRRRSLRILPTVSYGSAKLAEYDSIVDAKARADQNMYEYKKRRKAEKQAVINRDKSMYN